MRTKDLLNLLIQMNQILHIKTNIDFYSGIFYTQHTSDKGCPSIVNKKNIVLVLCFKSFHTLISRIYLNLPST